MSNTTGSRFRVTTFGESHGMGVGAVIDGYPPGLPLSEKDIQSQLDRRRPGQSRLSTPRDEADQVQILSGVERGLTLGTPIGLLVYNRDTHPSDYQAFAHIPRPSHADYTTQCKYGLRASSGGGRASARETVGRVAAGAAADVFLQRAYGVEIVAWVEAAGEASCNEIDPAAVTRALVDAHPTRCPDPVCAERVAAAIEAARQAGDSVGSIVGCVCRGLPAGWGDPVFGKLEAALAAAMLSIPAARGFEIGSGFRAAGMRASQHNDPFVAANGRLGTATNHSGGVQGGISNGEAVFFRVAFKPPPTIGLPQETAAFDGRRTRLEGRGRHDPCVAPRAVPVVEAMTALVLADAALAQRSIQPWGEKR